MIFFSGEGRILNVIVSNLKPLLHIYICCGWLTLAKWWLCVYVGGWMSFCRFLKKYKNCTTKWTHDILRAASTLCEARVKWNLMAWIAAWKKLFAFFFWNVKLKMSRRLSLSNEFYANLSTVRKKDETRKFIKFHSHSACWLGERARKIRETLQLPLPEITLNKKLN